MEGGLDAACKGEEIAVARHCIWYPRSDQKVGVESAKGRNNHSDGKPLGASRSDQQSNHVGSNVLRVRYVRESEQVEVHPIDQEVEKDHEERSENRGSWKISCWVEYLTAQRP